MTLRRRLVSGMALLLIAGIVASDVVTSSSLRSFLYGRLDEQISVAQDQAYVYVVGTYLRDVAAGSRLARTDPTAWLARLASPTLAEDHAPDTGTGIGSGTGTGIASGTGTGIGSGTGTGIASGTGTGIGSGGGARVARRMPSLDPGILSARVSPDVYLLILGPSGTVLFRRPSGSRDQQDPPPLLPAHLPVQSHPRHYRFGARHGVYTPGASFFTVKAATRGGPHYEAAALALPGGTLVTLVARSPSSQTIESLDHVEILVSLLVVLALIGLTWWITRAGLRPLEEMAATAGAIADGDLSRRVAYADERSEVGRLGRALNGMLAQIEAAFRGRTASEARLRHFVADASHELRTPLTSIRGYAELLRKGALESEEDRQSAADRIEREAARMGVLVDDLLLLARLDQGRPLDLAPVDFTELVGEAVQDAAVASPDRPHTFDSPGPLVVLGDSDRLRQAVGNLLSNARVHTQSGTPVHVGLRADGGRVFLRVEDEGPGLSDDQAERVFDRFYRAPGAPAREGSGLGLAIVAAIAEAHEGSARVVRSASRGAAFEIELPLGSFPTGEPAGSHPAPRSLDRAGRERVGHGVGRGVGNKVGNEVGNARP